MFTIKKFYHLCDLCNSEASQLKWLLTGFTTALICLSIISLLFLSACFFYLAEQEWDIQFKNTMLKNYQKFRNLTRKGPVVF